MLFVSKENLNKTK